MSRLAAAIRAHETSERTALPPMTHLTIHEAYEPPPIMQALAVGKMYRIGAQFESRCILSDDLASRARIDAVAMAVERARRAITEEVFGEYRRPLIEIVRAADNHDMSTVIEIAESILSNFGRPEEMK